MKTNRRDFVKKASLTTAGIGLISAFPAGAYSRIKRALAHPTTGILFLLLMQHRKVMISIAKSLWLIL
ncbi:hypothetical protein ES705_50321 [subsurface metagenome]